MSVHWGAIGETVFLNVLLIGGMFAAHMLGKMFEESRDYKERFTYLCFVFGPSIFAFAGAPKSKAWDYLFEWVIMGSLAMIFGFIEARESKTPRAPAPRWRPSDEM